jgi:hypothetical protein
MPLAAVIDQDIFCVHGGIPRPITQNHDGTYASRVQDILDVPPIAGINPPLEYEDEHHQQVASDCIWSDPASDEQEMNSVDPESGYGESLRGGGAICFGHKAVKDFLAQHGFSYIMVSIHAVSLHNSNVLLFCDIIPYLTLFGFNHFIFSVRTRLMQMVLL